jgi:hypothetical protein
LRDFPSFRLEQFLAATAFDPRGIAGVLQLLDVQIFAVGRPNSLG